MKLEKHKKILEGAIDMLEEQKMNISNISLIPKQQSNSLIITIVSHFNSMLIVVVVLMQNYILKIILLVHNFMTKQ